MASGHRRRSRSLESETEDESRSATPLSTARNDSKRARLSVPNGNNVDTANASRPRSMNIPQSSTSQMENPTGKRLSGRPQHQPGSIVRVKLTNFVTYTSAEFYPGPSLNMVIGPNGTGKSTLVCAICLGLGWGTQYLGRAKDAAEFVKHGSREATIEIELQRRDKGPGATRRNPVIKRTIKKEGNKSTYFLNGNQSTGKAVQSLAQSYDIQIDNLCQFLPQDKVVEFAQMTPIEILSSTMKAAAGSDMVGMHENLKKLRAAQREAMSNNRGDRDELKNLQNRQDMQRTEVDRMRERAAVKKRLHWLEKCRPIPLFSEAKQNANEAKAKEKELSRQLKQLKEDSGPRLKKVTAKQLYAKDVDQLKTNVKTEVGKHEKTCDAIMREIETQEGKITDLDNNFKAEASSVKPKKEEIRRLQQKIINYNNQKAQQPEAFDARQMNEEVARLTREKRQHESEENDFRRRKEELGNQGTETKNSAKQLQRRLDGLDSQMGKKADKLNDASKDTSAAWEWIQENRGQFEGEVYGPPLIECSLKNARMANAVESLLQENDFKIITVQTQKDFNLLQQKLMSELKLHDVSLRHCPITSLDQFRPPLAEEDLQRHGLDSWAIDQIEGPAAVLAMLCVEKSLHQCALSSRDVSQQQHDAIAQSAVRSYVAGGKSYQFVRRAEYGTAGTVARTRAVRPARWWTDLPVDMGRKAALQRDIAEKKGELSIIKNEYDELTGKIEEAVRGKDSLGTQIEQIRLEKEAKQKALTEWKALDTKITEAEEKIATAREAIEDVRSRQLEIVQKRDVLLLQKAESILRYAAATRSFREQHEKLIEVEIMHIEAVSDFQTLKSRNEETLSVIRKMQEEVEEATRIFRQQTDIGKQLVKTVTDLQKESRKLQEEGDHSLSNLLEEYRIGQWKADDLEAQIDAETARLELSEGGNANIIEEFEERARKIEHLETRLRDADERQADFKHGITEIRQQWEPRLQALISTISDAFSDSFARIGCAGLVQVHKASSADLADCVEENGGQDNGLDFANWAIHISVKFRENEPLSLLDSHRQSGGERAVSTIFYLMALQSLSRAPFRVVDEINQGMDPRNERMVHGRMVDIATDNGGSQYFLITPKLLNGLKYRPGMTVLCIVSGENMPPAQFRDESGQVVQGPKVDFRAFVAKAKELQINNSPHSGFGQENNGALTAAVGA